MSEFNPLLPNEHKKKHSSTASISTITSEITSEIPYTINDPPAEIVSYKPHNLSVNNSPQRQQEQHRNNPQNYQPMKPPPLIAPVNRSPNSSRSKGDKIGNYNLDYIGKIPLASNFIFLFILFGILLALLAIASSVYIVLTTEGQTTEDHSDITNIILPLVIYIMNMVQCSLFYLESRAFQMRGYTQFFQNASKLTKINFRFVSMYCVMTYAAYSFILHHHTFFSNTHDIDVIFLAIWCFIYVFIIGCLCKFADKFHVHNRDQPKPDLFVPHPNNNNRNQNMGIVDDQTEVIQKLYKDKSTLIRQLNTLKRKFERTKAELQQIQNDNASLLDHGGIIWSGGDDGNNDVVELKNQLQKLRGKLRSEREQTRTLATQIETKKTMLEAQIAETEQLRNVLQTKDDRISQLMNEKESLERTVHACNDQKDDLSLLYQVKEQEVEIAKKENERLRKKLQLTMQNVQNF